MAKPKKQSPTDGKFVEVHGLSFTREYGNWGNMIYRCHTPTAKDYDSYGGRGIQVCARWRESFEAFLEDMGPRPTDQHSIERIDNDGNYEPANCRWATKREQGRNRRSSVRYEFNGQARTLIEISELTGLSVNMLKNRVRRGWSLARIFQPPTGPYAERMRGPNAHR